MSEMKAFFAQNAQRDMTEDYVVSDAFKDKDGKPIPWKLRAISEGENEDIRRSSTYMSKGKNGVKVPEIKQDEYIGKLAVASIVFPDLKNAELQKSYEVMGAEMLLKRMLLAGEYSALVQKIQEINGFDKDINNVVDEVKNA